MSDVRARVQCWPAELAARFEEICVDWYRDRDARFLAELLEDLLADVLAPLDVALDTDPRLAAKLGALLKHIDERRDLMPDQPPSDRHGLDRIKEQEWLNGERIGTGQGEFRKHDPNRDRPVLHWKPARPFPEPDWLGEDRPR